jgi:hypothetical protein
VDPNTGLDVVPGCQKLDRFQGFAYVRASSAVRAGADFARIGRQQQFMRAVIDQMLKPAQIAKAPGLVAPVLASLHRGQTSCRVTCLSRQPDARAQYGSGGIPGVPATFGMENGLSVLHMDPSAERCGVDEARHGRRHAAGQHSAVGGEHRRRDRRRWRWRSPRVEDTLTNAGFNVTPGIVSGEAQSQGAAMLIAPVTHYAAS